MVSGIGTNAEAALIPSRNSAGSAVDEAGSPRQNTCWHLLLAGAPSVMAPNELRFRIEGRRIWVAGHRGMVGSAVIRRLARRRAATAT
jgi:hypothetical protein